MKATLTASFGSASAPIVLAKLEQWTEFLQAEGIQASFTVEDEVAGPMTDMHTVLESFVEGIESGSPADRLEAITDQPREEDYEVCPDCGGSGVNGYEGDPDLSLTDQWNDKPCRVCGELAMSEYLPIDEAAKVLGKGYSRSSILRRIDEEWIEGVHWIDDRRSGTAYRRIKINVESVMEWRKIPAAKRAPAEKR